MNEETTSTVETTEETLEEKVTRRRNTPTEAELKKKIKELQKENEALALQLEQYREYVQAATTQKQQMEAVINGLQAKYTRITNYIKQSTSVFHQSVLLAFEEEVK